jgi:hypothetical protein
MKRYDKELYGSRESFRGNPRGQGKNLKKFSVPNPRVMTFWHGTMKINTFSLLEGHKLALEGRSKNNCDASKSADRKKICNVGKKTCAVKS